MLIPIGDTPNNSSRVPYMNYALLAANVLVYLWLASTARSEEAYQKVLWDWGYIPADGGVLRLFTCMFLHGDWLHLGGNMLFLYIFGDNVEARLGSLGYLVAYLATGAVATLAFALGNADSIIPLVGASGAISGVQGMYFIACPRHRVKMLFWFYWFINVFQWNARWVMVFWFVSQDVLALLGASARPGGVAHLAHLGGFGAGLLVMLALRPLMPRIELAAIDEDGSHASRYRRSSEPRLRLGNSQRYPPRGQRSFTREDL